MPDTGTVGSGASNISTPANTVSSLRLGNLTDLIVSELHGNQYETSYRQALFSGGNQAVVTTALPSGLTATYTGGLSLVNPIGNTKNLVLRTASVGVILAQTNAAVIGLGVGYSPSVAASGTLTVVPSQCNLLNGPTATGILYSSASVTLPTTPYLARVIGSFATGALTVQTVENVLNYDAGGGIILPPGGFVCFTSSAAGTASSAFFSMTWEEVPI